MTAENMTTATNHGAKHTCANPSCMTKFFDLNKLPAACPKCHLAVPVRSTTTVKRRPRRNSSEMPIRTPNNV